MFWLNVLIRIEYDAMKVKITNHREMKKYVKESARKSWKYGEEA